MTRDTFSRRFSVRLLTTAVACAGLTLASPAAFADKYGASDERGDSLAFPDGDTSNPVVDPDHTDADIVKSKVNHSNRRVVVKVKLRDLTSLGSDEFIQLYADIKTNKKRQAAISYKHGGDKTGFYLARGGKQLKCAGAKKKVSPGKNLIKFSVPRSCLGNPKWVKVGLAALSGSGSDFHHDDALSSRTDLDHGIRHTPKLKKG